MKKLLFVLAVGCAASLVHAAAANWSASASEIYNGTGSSATTAYAAGIALIFDADVMSQSSLYGIFNAGTTINSGTSGYLTEATLSGGGFSNAGFTNGDQGGSLYNYYFAIVQDDQIYLSNIVGRESNSSASPKGVAFDDQYDTGNPYPNSVALATEGYVGEGRWAAKTGSEPVPEPTSGLLLLIGVAGLALKRKRI